MRSCAAALVVLAILTECLGADRSRQRSGPVRSVPVAANVKRDVNFDCPEEFGYYPHPTDCTLYYVCVFGGALLESCTGGLMYSHELQTCDWPRNVGCDGASAVGGDEIERLPEREYRPQTSRRTPPPPPPRAQPNPVVTSRGQPKFNRDEYEKQQQLYAEVDDLPPVEEIESDRQQRVYRGQPSTIGQVQKDRDGYSSQVVSSGRNFNSNIIPASISQNSGKIGSFSFGSQVDDRRTATVTQAPQSYSEDKTLTDSHHDRFLDIETNEIDDDVTKLPVLKRIKREVADADTFKNVTVSDTNNDTISKRSGGDEVIEYFEIDSDKDNEEKDHILDDSERGKRQIRYYFKNGQKPPNKNWAILKPIKFVDSVPQPSYNPSVQSHRYQPNYNINNNYYGSSRRPYSLDSNSYSAANPFLAYQSENSQVPFKASLPDPYQKFVHNPLNIATQIVTKSPPISSLNNQNPYESLNGGIYNNAPQTYNNQYSPHSDYVPRQNNQITFKDSSLLPSTIVTDKPILMSTPPRNLNQYNNQPQKNDNNDENDSEEEYDSSEDEDDEEYSHRYPKPPYEFRHPSNKYADIDNPFANPNFDFDEYLSKLSNGQYTTYNPKNVQQDTAKNVNRPVESTTPHSSGVRSSSLNYQGMSTPRPFSVIPGGFHSTLTPQRIKTNEQYNQNQQVYQQQQQQQQSSNLNSYNQQQLQQYSNQNAGIPLEAIRPKLKPPNFKDDRQLPISYSFNRPIEISTKSNSNQKLKSETQPIYSTSKPYIFLTATGTPIILSSPKAHYVVKNEKIVSQQPFQVSTGKPYLISSHNGYITLKQSTPKPLTTLANEQLSALHNFWKSTTESISSQSVTLRPNTPPDVDKLNKLFAQAVKTSMQSPTNNKNAYEPKYSSTTKAPKRRLIPKPSPEMNDYYYDDDEYYEPPVKPKYMPSTEIKPQRPPMAQNYKEYDDESYEDSEEEVVNISPRPTPRKPIKLTYKPETVTKNYNDVSIVTKSPIKDYKNGNGKIPIPVFVDYATPTPLIRPQVGNIEIIHNPVRNRTLHLRRPLHEIGPNTIKPPKYLNQTTLRPYTVRHRLAKPTTVQEHTTQTENQVTRAKGRHPNIVAQMLTTPRDSHNQETRITKAKYDGRTNSLEPTESVAPLSYSPSPRPKMLYNGSQNYSPDQYDPFYAIYDEDGELYKDTDYVQQYNVASVRPAVQQTYRGTPPPARRPVDNNYSPRPVPVSPDDYDDALIQGQINNHNQNQFQSPVRHSTRGEGNELGYEHIPSSVRTTIYEATPISTTPTTTSTSTTTQRPTIAPYTEAMTPSRYTPRSSTDENPLSESNPFLSSNSSEESVSSFPSTPSPVINLSSLAKPFEKTDNEHSLEEILPTTERMTSLRQPYVTNNNNDKSVDVVRPEINKDTKKIVSLTTGFSIRRNSNNTNNPYTLTVLTRPFDDFGKGRKKDGDSNSKDNPSRYYYENSSENIDKPIETAVINKSQYEKSSESSLRRKDSRYEINDDYDIPIYIRPTTRSRYKTSRVKSTTDPSTSTTKYYLKSVVKRPAPFSKETKRTGEKTENAVDTVQVMIDAGLQNVKYKTDIQTTTSKIVEITPKRVQSERIFNKQIEPTVSPYKTLENLRNFNRYESLVQDSSTSTVSTSLFTTNKDNIYFKSRDNIVRSKPSYYSYRIEDEEVPDHTTEVFSSGVKNVIKAFFNSLVSTPVPQGFSSTYKPSSSSPKPETKVVNIGYQKRPAKHVDEKPLRNNVQRLQIISDVIPNVPTTSSDAPKGFAQSGEPDNSKDFSSTSTMTPLNTIPYIFTIPATTPILRTSTTTEHKIPSVGYQSKFNKFLPTTPKLISTTPKVFEISQKFQKILKVDDSPNSYQEDDINLDGAVTPLEKTNIESTKASETEWQRPSSEVISEIASTTSTTKSTTTKTVMIDPTTKMTTKSVSFPTRASRVNPAIKLAASNPGSGHRSYQSSSKCISDNSLQANPKCNEIKYQRPTSTRGRGSAHYSTSGSESSQPTPNRGTPPTRSRPTLKPSTAIVSENIKFTDIYASPPSRPAPVYPQPTPDKTAAKCRKDVCLLPDCYCGGKDIPGNLPVNEVPQIVLITFDDAVNDLNKMYYEELFERGRVNPNGCPISATFYVSHEWTDYSQVQNLYADGHELASHTISHSFGEQFSQKKWNREVGGQREILAAYGGVKLDDVRGMRAPFLSIGGNKMFKMLYDSNFTYDSSMPVYENRPPSWPYTLDYKLFHDCMIPPCPTKSYPGVWEVPMVMWQDLNGGRCSMGDACANPPEPENVYKMLLKNFDRHYTTNRAPFGLFYHAAWFTQPHHKEGFIMFLDFINRMQDVWIVTNWQALQWVRDPTPISRINSFQPFQCNYQDRPKKCNNPKVCNLWHKSGVRYMRTCQPCPEVYPWTGKSGIRSSRIDNDNGE